MIEKYNSKYIEYSENELVICIGETDTEDQEKYITVKELIIKNPKIEPFLHLEPRFSFVIDEDGEDVWEEEF